MARGPVSPAVARFMAARQVGAAGPPLTGTLGDRINQGYDRAFHRYEVNGERADVSPHFRMAGGFNQKNVAAGMKALEGRLGTKPGQVPLDVAGRVMAGRGTPADVGRVTQALIDAGKLPAADTAHPTLESRIRQMMWDHGVGIDCAGYVQQTLAAAHGKTPAQLGLKDPLNEDLGALDHNPNFQRRHVLDAAVGDVITLKDVSPSEPGHTVLVAEHLERTGAEMVTYFKPGDPRAEPFLRSRALTVLVVDSSWGAGEHGKAEGAGVNRQTWIHDRETGQWAAIKREHTPAEVTGETPYDGHTLVGAYGVR
ncbi:MAG: hypothetical protein EOO75_15250 [Myxococcales bacterium]|nr:MAG: hypothetical protein EOO75_15250 [Myxococcales bacterium]